MPMIIFESGKLKPGVKEELIRQLTDVCVAVTGIPKHLYFIAIHELPDDDVAVGGETVRELKEKLAQTSQTEAHR
jgi:4-oxalocrotonate tautomerase